MPFSKLRPNPIWTEFKIFENMSVSNSLSNFIRKTLNPNYPWVFSKQFILGRGKGGVIITPIKIHHFNGSCTFCFYSGLDMYIKGYKNQFLSVKLHHVPLVFYIWVGGHCTWKCVQMFFLRIKDKAECCKGTGRVEISTSTCQPGC